MDQFLVAVGEHPILIEILPAPTVIYLRSQASHEPCLEVRSAIPHQVPRNSTNLWAMDVVTNQLPNVLLPVKLPLAIPAVGLIQLEVIQPGGHLVRYQRDLLG